VHVEVGIRLVLSRVSAPTANTHIHIAKEEI
jgi:hypothetical protein